MLDFSIRLLARQQAELGRDQSDAVLVSTIDVPTPIDTEPFGFECVDCAIASMMNRRISLARAQLCLPIEDVVDLVREAPLAHVLVPRLALA